MSQTRMFNKAMFQKMLLPSSGNRKYADQDRSNRT